MHRKNVKIDLLLPFLGVFLLGIAPGTFAGTWLTDSMIVRSILDQNGQSSVSVQSVSMASNSRITALNFPNGIISHLPDSIEYLDTLLSIMLINQPIHFLPQSIGNLKCLESIWIWGLPIDSLPVSMTKLDKLKYLRLTQTNTHSLPDSIGLLRSLQTLICQNTSISAIPLSIKKLTNLCTLEISYSKLSDIPIEIGALKNLRCLNLDSNAITYLPEETTFLDSLTELSISGNRLSSLPDSLQRLTKLASLDVSCNRISMLPPVIQIMPSILPYTPKSGCSTAGCFPYYVIYLNVRLNYLCQVPSDLDEWLKIRDPDWKKYQLADSLSCEPITTSLPLRSAANINPTVNLSISERAIHVSLGKPAACIHGSIVSVNGKSYMLSFISKSEIDIPVNKFPAGIYILQLTSDNARATARFVVK